MNRVALLAGSSVVVAQVPPGSVALHPPPPAAALADIPEAVAEALRFPLAGEPLRQLVKPGGYATVVIEPPSLPIPGATIDPRAIAVAATVEELERAGVPLERQTILVACGLQKRPTPREIGQLVPPDFRRRFRGRLVVHDAEDEQLVDLGGGVRVNQALIETDLVVVVSAAESVLHGGPAVFLGASSPEASVDGDAPSLLESRASAAWRRAIEIERGLHGLVPVIGVSLALNHPLPGGALRGFPHDEAAIERIAASPARKLFRLVPRPLRRAVILGLPLELGAFAAFAGPPSVAHAEALVRAIDRRAVSLEEPLDAIVVPIPPTTPWLPRERPNPVSVSYLALGLALRFWRSAPPLKPGGTVILMHHFRRSFAIPTQQPFRAFFREPRSDYERDEQAIDHYRSGRTCHPLLPYAEWSGCQPAIRRAGAVLVAGCRDASSARQLGFVPTHGLGAAVEMAHGLAGGEARIGFLVGPPYFPLLGA
jgi:Lactate racemase N-terminal domain